MQSHFRVEVQADDRAHVITVEGELDLASSPALQEQVEQSLTGNGELLIVDLRELEFMDSTGLSILVKAHHRARETGKHFAIVRGSEQVQRLLSLTGVGERLTVVDDPEELLREG